MAALMTSLVDPATNMFCNDGRLSGRIVVEVPYNPDVRGERYTGDPLNPIRPATAQEILDADSAALDADAATQFDASKVIKAALVTALWTALGHQPTAAEITTAKTRFKAVYKAL